MKKYTRKNNKPSSAIIYKQIVNCYMGMLNTVKLYHWKTTSYSTHKATDQLYSDLNSKIDEFVEVMLGKPELIKARNYILNVEMIKLKKYNTNKDFKKEVDYYKNFLIDLSQKKEFSRDNKNADLLAIRDEILAVFNQFLYLLTLENLKTPDLKKNKKSISLCEMENVCKNQKIEILSRKKVFIIIIKEKQSKQSKHKQIISKAINPL